VRDGRRFKILLPCKQKYDNIRRPRVLIRPRLPSRTGKQRVRQRTSAVVEKWLGPTSTCEEGGKLERKTVAEDHEEEEVEALYRLSCKGDDTLGRGIKGIKVCGRSKKRAMMFHGRREPSAFQTAFPVTVVANLVYCT